MRLARWCSAFVVAWSAQASAGPDDSTVSSLSLLGARDFINTTGLSSFVGWDPHSFFLNGSRIFLQSGEMHPWRLPVPALWKDVLEKFKAAGLNAVSIYTHWALMNPKKGVLDLEGINDLQLFLDAAREVGIFVIARPGPYINAETTGGGVPGHVLTLPDRNTWFPYNGELRSNDTLFEEAWKDYVTAVGTIIAKNQVTNGGPVILLQIENEYYNGPGISEYFAQLTKTYRDLGVVIPTMDNDPGMFRNLINDVNIYGIDAYPVSFDCSNPFVWRDTPSPAWRPYHESVNPESPFFFPEFQGGSFDKWGSVGREGCHQLTGVNFQRVYYHQLWASGVTAVNFYMVFGGTNWGQLPYPPAVTSYDYSAAISESRQLIDKYGELKLQSMFLRSFPDFRKTNFISEDNTTHIGINTTHLGNPDTGAEWLISRHQVTNDSSTLQFHLDVGQGTNVPQVGGSITLAGRDSIVVSVNLKFGAHSRIVYSTAALFSTLVVDGQDVLIVYGALGQTFEVALSAARKPNVSSTGPTKLTTKFANNAIILNFSPAAGMTVVQINGVAMTPMLLVIADYDTATRFWMPTIPSPVGGPLSNFVDLGAQTLVLVAGPYLVRTASLQGGRLELSGDLHSTTRLTILAPKHVVTVTWNGALVEGISRARSGILEAVLPGPRKTWTLPDLTKATWRFADSLPEISPSFSEAAQAASGMIDANKTTTTNPFPPYYGGPTVLYGSDYGFHSGNLVWRGKFEHDDSLSTPTAVNLSISGGQFFAASVWLNDVYLGATDTTVMTANLSLPVTSDMLRTGDNYVTVLQDHMGHNLAGQIVCCTPGGRQRDIQLPRGIQGYYLVGRLAEAQFTGWKVAGNFRGEDFPDKTRKILNEGGLFGERMGWHLPGFNDVAWEKRTPWQGLDAPGVGWFRTTFTLSIPDDHDVPLAFEFAAEPGQYRAQLYVNGWQMGKRIANQGPQVTFPVHPGIINMHGTNTVAVSLWALGGQPADLKIPSLRLVQLASFSGGPGRIPMNNPGWEELRGSL